MRTGLIVMTLLLTTALTASAAPTRAEIKRVREAAAVISELRSAPDSGIAEGIWNHARCVAVMPSVKKAAFVVGGEFGRGVVSCKANEHWTAPVFVTLEKGSIGTQIGAESSDIVLLIMNERGVERLMQDKVTLGADASIVAGPVGRSGTAATDAAFTAEMLSYSRARGLFAGIDLSGGVLKPDKDASRQFYGHAVEAREVLIGKETQRIPAAATPFMSALKAEHTTTARHHA